ncbi:hypothetical protein DDZ18_09800 [Marinicauda salina]|uniref:TonB C-terminal domain-containing protein n=1 Tax=Marinicauda salina TaxID=2135793 RepID=A0A2U2BSK4_9PROT|nr:energy transducer TonB [Marinicauda salina]PWE16989.1 hypothetical protein DDZ18_09800 [Marinicauda salina]
MTASLRRIAVWGPAAAAVTLLLFMLMQVLIATEVIPPPAAPERLRVAISDVVKPYQPEPIGIDDIERSDPPPPRPDIREVDRGDAPGDFGSGYIAPAGPGPETGQVEPVAMVGGSTPLVRVPPAYPAAEASRGIEGRCAVRFDVLASGRVTNIQVTACDSRGFARATESAVAQWRYRADPTRNPDTVALRGVRTELVFELRD